ncbi:MAG: M15 family metallopeptidase [Deltaproteobacteria bacterium]|nr:M15 family metallopeptidase [Deltaproteobacteria bacterium]
MRRALLTLLFLSAFHSHCLPAHAAPSSLVVLEGPNFLLSLQYDSDHNFLKKNVYADFNLHQCYVHPDLAAKLQALAPKLAEKKLKLVLWDCYRPLAVQQAMWKLVPDSRYVANPKSGSNHNRGIAVDVSLAKEDGTLVEMPTAFDDFTSFAGPKSPCKPEQGSLCGNRDLLIELMATVGLAPLPTEWWHYQLPSAKKYPIIEAIDAKKP